MASKFYRQFQRDLTMASFLDEKHLVIDQAVQQIFDNNDIKENLNKQVNWSRALKALEGDTQNDLYGILKIKAVLLKR